MKNIIIEFVKKLQDKVFPYVDPHHVETGVCPYCDSDTVQAFRNPADNRDRFVESYCLNTDCGPDIRRFCNDPLCFAHGGEGCSGWPWDDPKYGE